MKPPLPHPKRKRRRAAPSASPRPWPAPPQADPTAAARLAGGRCALTGLLDTGALLVAADAACAQVLAAAADTPAPAVAMLALKVPQTKQLADSLGPAAADGLVSALADRLVNTLPAGLAVGHLGEGEFAWLLPQRTGADRSAALQWAQRWQAALHAPVALGGLAVYPQCRIGLALAPDDADDGHALLAAARAARRETSAGDPPACFRADTRRQGLRRLHIESGLRHAVAREEFHLRYLPQACLGSGRMVGAEAMLCWRSAELGEVAAEEFGPVAERAGLTPALGDWLIQQVCAQIARWHRAGLPALRVAVNVTPLHFQLGNLAAGVRRALASTGADPSALALELTEAALAHDAERGRRLLKTLRADGVGLTLGRFGTGASSLDSLRSLPIDLLKIDRSFVADMGAVPEAAAVTRSMLQLAHALGIGVLADGVDTEGQRRMLAAEACDRIQGRVVSPPLDAEAMAALLAADHRLPMPAAPRAARERSLLLVDDEAPILSALRRLFRREGYRIHTAGDGAAALELLAREPVDVILSDHRMPGMTGVDFLRRAKALHPQTVRLALSGFTDLQSIIDAVNEGAVYKFLTKPWDDERLRGHVAEAFARKELADDNRRLQAEVAAAHAEQASLNRRLAHMLERQKTQAELLQAGAGALRRMVEALPTALIGVDADGLVAYTNPAALAWLAALDSHPGMPAGRPLRQLLARLGDAGPGHDGMPLHIGVHTLRAWHVDLGAAGSAHNRMLVLAPPEDADPPAPPNASPAAWRMP